MSLNPNALPSLNFDLSSWKLQLPVDVAGTNSGKAAEVKVLTNYFHKDHFYTGFDGAMVLTAHVNGATTGGSIYARSELREMNGTANAEWNLQEGGHLSATLQVDAAPRHVDGTYGKVVVGQVHGGDGQLVRLAWEDGTLFFANDITSNGAKDVHIELRNDQGEQPSVSLNETFSYDIDVSADRLVVSVTADGQVYTSSSAINDAWNDNSFYFKAGAYLGVNEANGHGIGQVSVFSIDVGHLPSTGSGELPRVERPIGQEIRGGSSDDVLTGGVGDDRVFGLEGNDAIFGSSGSDVLDGGKGQDEIHGDEGSDTLTGGSGRDLLNGGTGADFMFGGADNDILTGGEGSDIIDGGGGIDLASFANATSSVTADLATNENSGDALGDFFKSIEGLLGGDWSDYLSGDNRANNLGGGNGNDTLDGRAGKDHISGDAGDDALYGGDNNDLLFGGLGEDFLRGDQGADALYGDQGSDRMFGGTGNDKLFGGDQNDMLDAGSGNDLLVGGLGSDTFIYGVGYGSDRIDDFSSSDGDTIGLSLGSRFDTYDEVIAAAKQVGADTVIKFGGGSITLTNVAISSLAPDDFWFS